MKEVKQTDDGWGNAKPGMVSINKKFLVGCLCLGVLAVAVFTGSPTKKEATPSNTQHEAVRRTPPDAKTVGAPPLPPEGKLPFGNPVYLLGRNMESLSEKFQVPLNSAGNLVISTSDYRLLVESRDRVNATYVDIEVKQLGTCTQGQEAVDKTEEILKTAGVSTDRLVRVRENPSTGFVVYQLRDMEISTGCLYDEAPYFVGVRYPN